MINYKKLAIKKYKEYFEQIPLDSINLKTDSANVHFVYKNVDIYINNYLSNPKKYTVYINQLANKINISFDICKKDKNYNKIDVLYKKNFNEYYKNILNNIPIDFQRKEKLKNIK